MLQILGGNSHGVGDRLPLEFAEYRSQGNGNKGHHKQGEGKKGLDLLFGGGPDPVPFGQQRQCADDEHGAQLCSFILHR